MVICSVFLRLLFLTVCGVFGDEVKSVSVMEGQNVTLHTDDVKQRDDRIVWYYGPENTFVARMNGMNISTIYSDDERFRDRLKLNNQTGDLNITHITSQHSGLYTLKISRNMKVSHKRFNLTIYSRLSVPALIRDSDSPNMRRNMRIIILSVIFALLICMIFFIIKHKMRVQAGFVKAATRDSSSSSKDFNSSRSQNEQKQKHILVF